MTATKVVLIGGPPMVGKTTVSRTLSVRLGWSALSTDDIGRSIRAVTTPESHPDLHPMRGFDYQEYYTSRSTEELISEADRHHRAAWPAVAAVIKSHARWAGPLIIEGWALMPEAVAGLDLPGVASLWLVAEGGVLEDRVRREESFWRGAYDEELMVRRYLARSAWHNQRIRHDATRLGLTLIPVEASSTPDDLCNLCVETLTFG